MASVPLQHSCAFVPHSADIPLIHHQHRPPCSTSYGPLPRRRRAQECSVLNPLLPYLAASNSIVHSVPPRSRLYTVGDFMTKKKGLYVVKTTTAIEEAWEVLVDKRISGFPVINDDWELVGVVSDYDLLALDSISGGGAETNTNLFPDVNSSWNSFNEMQNLLGKATGKVIGDLMTQEPLFVHESTSLEDAARLLLENKFRRLPVVEDDGKLVGLITRGNVVGAALHIKRAAALLPAGT